VPPGVLCRASVIGSALGYSSIYFHLRWKCEIKVSIVQGSVAVIIIIRLPVKKERRMSCGGLHSHNGRGHVATRI